MKAINKLTIDINSSNSTKIINAKKNDVNSRYIEVEITCEKGRMVIPDTASVVLCVSNIPTKGFEGNVLDGNAIICLPMASINECGYVKAEVTIIDGNSRITTPSFNINVFESIYNTQDIVSDSEYDVLVSLIEETRNEKYEMDSKLSYISMMQNSNIIDSTIPAPTYNRIRDWYNKGYWNNTMIKNAVTKKIITNDEYNSIII